jgi:hypothetical protein
VAKLNIYVGSTAGQTQSQFGKVKDSDKIVFYNQDPAATLTVTIKGDQPGVSALCKPNGQGVDSLTVTLKSEQPGVSVLCKPNGQPAGDSFTVAPAERSKGFTICDGYQAATFKYTAQVGTAAPEDPIIIIERWSIANSTVGIITAAGLAVAGLIVGALGARLLMRRTGSPG